MNLFIDYFLDGVMEDCDLACYHEKFKEPDHMDELKFKLHALFKYTLDGSQYYIGKDLYTAHENLGISDEVFDRTAAVFSTQLRRIKPKMKVFREFVKRVGAMRPQIVIPLPEAQEAHCKNVKAKQFDNEEEEEEKEGIPLIETLGGENGLKKIVESVFTNSPDIFSKWNTDAKTKENMYTYFICTMISSEFEWMATTFLSNMNQMQIQDKDFDQLTDAFKQACKEKEVGKNATSMLLEKLSENKKKICADEDSQDMLIKSQSISSLVQRNKSCESFIREFLLNIGRQQELANSEYFKDESRRQHLVVKVSKILASESHDDLSIDEEIMNNIPVNSEDPEFLASEVFRDTLLGFGVTESGANNARGLFLAIKKDKVEETQNLMLKIAS